MYPGRVVHTWWASVILSIAVATVAFAFASLGEGHGRSSDLAHSSENLLRLHVIAHSDMPEDQNAKLKVRDAILREMAGWRQPADSGQLERWVSERESALIDAARRALLEMGHEREVRVETGPFAFPQKEWGGMILPAGEYRAIRIVIGDGAGQNWWCVLFPPLCFVEESGELVAGSVAHAHEHIDAEAGEAFVAPVEGGDWMGLVDSGGPYQGDPSDFGEWTEAEVAWRLRLWESLSDSAVLGRVREWVDASLSIAQRLSP